MARPRWLDRSFPVLGGRVPAPVALLIGATFVASIAGASSPRLLESASLVPDQVTRGEIWRLVTWPLFQLEPLGLIFGGLALYWCGSALVRVWGPGRFLASYFGIAAAAGTVTTLLALGLEAMPKGFGGMWPLVDALIIAFAIYFPSQDVGMYFVLPVRGRNLITVILLGTLIFALLGGSFTKFLFFTPHFAAELLMLAALRGTSMRLFAGLRDEIAYRRWRLRASKLKAVPTPPRQEPPRWTH